MSSMPDPVTNETYNTTWSIEHVGGDDYAFRTALSGTYVTAEPSGAVTILRSKRQDWETFTLTPISVTETAVLTPRHRDT